MLTIILPSIVTVIYLATSAAFAFRKEWAWSTVYAGYALANVGLIIASMKG